MAVLPFAAVGFALIPLAGDFFDGLPGFVLTVMIMLVAMATIRVPLFALLPDLTVPERRSTANGIINLFGGIGILIATWGWVSLACIASTAWSVRGRGGLAGADHLAAGCCAAKHATRRYAVQEELLSRGR